MNTSRAAGADQGAPGTPPAADRADLSGLESSGGMGSPLSDLNRRPLPYHRTSRVHSGPAEPEESDLTGPERTRQDPTTTSRRPQDAPRSILAPARALSLTQPWATLVVVGAKRVETRSWRTPHRGLLGIHAAKGVPRWAVDLCFAEPFRTALRAAGITKPGDLPRGALIGSATLLDCVPTTGVELVGISDDERAFGDYSPGRWGWLLDAPAAFAEPRPCRGALGLWDIAKATA
jgi:activating signal cointegrator 1